MQLAPPTFALTTLIAAIAFPAVAQAAPAPAATLLYSFETPNDLKDARADNVTTAIVTRGATDGRHALRINFAPGEWPNLKWAAKQPWDWSGCALALDVTNPESSVTTFAVRVDDDTSADGVRHCRTGGAAIAPGKTVSFEMAMGIDPMSLGMRGVPATGNLVALGSNGSGPFDLSHIMAFQIFLPHPAAAASLIVDNIRLVPSPASDMAGIVDRFGQYTRADWPDKLHGESDFASRRLAEAADLEAHPTVPDRDRYGGWAAGPKLEASGYFRVAKYRGKWSFVDPDGRLFFSLGMDSMNPTQWTITSGRESMFTVLPVQDPVLARHSTHIKNILMGPLKEGDAVDFRGANLERKYGTGSLGQWRDTSLARLRSWGFNTVGNWPEAGFYANGRVPYVVTLSTGANHARLPSGTDYWRLMDDPFDPAFAADIDKMVQPLAAKYKEDPYCLGYFVGNEESWGGGAAPRAHYGLALGALSLQLSASPAKQALLGQLKAKYGGIADLNRAWGTSFADWTDLAAPYAAREPFSAAMQADFSAFLSLHAAIYFHAVREAIKRVDPNHLYLGCRFAGYTPEAVRAAATGTDVTSFNCYRRRIDPREWAVLAGLDHPCIIGEFHFGALDRGMFHAGLVPTNSQAERAQCFIDYVRSVLDNPLFIGCHWFEYIDEPLLGRSLDGENYNIGFVSETDTPYAEMVAAARQVGGEIYARRFK